MDEKILYVCEREGVKEGGRGRGKERETSKVNECNCAEVLIVRYFYNSYYCCYEPSFRVVLQFSE